MRFLTMTISEPHEGKKVDTILRKELGLSAASVRRAKEIPNGILLDKTPVFTNALVKKGQVLQVAVGDPQANEDIPPVPGPLDIRYEDGDVVILSKAGGVAVHPSPGHHGDTLANFLAHHYEQEGVTAAFHPVNRLDRGTSGLMAVAKHSHAHQRLQEQLDRGILRRTYLAVCEGELPEPRGTIDLPIRRAEGSVLKREVGEGGSPAVTHFRVLRTERGRSLVKLTLDTGRTHQIRVHLAHLGCPLVGDFLYGREDPGLPDRFALHSHEITLRQPVTGEELHLEDPLPRSLAALLEEHEGG